MLGFLRTILAVLVVTYHLFYSRAPLGIYPVFGFYIISGYLMTLIMQESYGYTLQGRVSYLVNRFLRLYPQYWAAAMITVILIYIFGMERVQAFHGSMFLPSTVLEYMENIFMTFVAWKPGDVNPRLVPPTWAITVEIFFYILIGTGISKTPSRVKAWLVLSIIYVIVAFASGLSWEDRYYPVAAASLPFAIGAGIYFASKKDKKYLIDSNFDISAKYIFILIIANCLFFAQMDSDLLIFGVGFYINLILCALLVYSVVTGGKIIEIGDSLDKKIGDFSYPVYLLHWQAGFVASYLLFQKPFHEYSFQGFLVLIVAFMGLYILSKVFITLIDKPIQVLRLRIKHRKQ